MQIIPVDKEGNLFRVESAMPAELAEKVLNTNWVNLPWKRQEGQEQWARRRIDDSAIPWLSEWDNACRDIWDQIEVAVGKKLHPYAGTAWWLDEPGFTCSLHTDGELPGSMHLTWVGDSQDLGTTFYWYKDPATVRCQFPMKCNDGYVMINSVSESGYRNLLWHGMLRPVPENTFRLTSYSWINYQ